MKSSTMPWEKNGLRVEEKRESHVSVCYTNKIFQPYKFLSLAILMANQKQPTQESSVSKPEALRSVDLAHKIHSNQDEVTSLK